MTGAVGVPPTTTTKREPAYSPARSREALEYVEFDVNVLLKKMRTDVESAVRDGKLDFQESGKLLRFYDEGLQGYTYLEDAN